MAAFTAIATGVGLAMSAGSTAMSFAEASRQRDRQGEAEKAAEEAMESARKRLEVNFYEGLSVQKEPYELQRESLLAGGAQGLQAAQSGERGVSAAAGRIAIAQQAGEAQIRTAMGREMAGLEKTALQEESRLRDALVDLDIGEVSGQQMIAQQARAQEDAATQAGIQGIQDTIGKGMSMVDLYAGSGGVDLDSVGGLNEPGIESVLGDPSKYAAPEIADVSGVQTVSMSDLDLPPSAEELALIKSNRRKNYNIMFPNTNIKK
jgi:hypothetical protein|tara:strand:- start:2523 stop:3311 length:789 start_codon:yes stop_codon:yes gene_type:complete